MLDENEVKNQEVKENVEETNKENVTLYLSYFFLNNQKK